MADGGRALVWRGPGRGQGVGSMMRGVAAALALGTKHSRLVCVSWSAFEQAFVNPAGCPSKEEYFTSGTSGTGMIDADAHFELWTFGGGADAAPPEALLASNRSIVLVSGDGGRVAEGLERLDFPFAPRAALLALLPTAPRRAVAHLRVGDEHEASRRGLFRWPNATDVLRSALPRDTYVLSDSASVYDALCSTLACPAWRALPHSTERAMRSSAGARGMHTLQTWADWWRLRTSTQHVLATPSAFASSAAIFSRVAHCILTDLLALERCAARAREGEAARTGGGETEGGLQEEL